MARHLPRREFLKGAAVGLGALAASPIRGLESSLVIGPSADISSDPLPAYSGPNVILVRFGGGVRRRETIDPSHTYSPYFLRELVPRGTFYPRMEISQLDGVETSHGQGTLFILTGKYEHYKDVRGRALGQRFEAPVPTLFEYLRRSYGIAEHQALIINGEDRTDEEFYSFSNHHLFGVDYRSSVLSLYRFKVYLLREQIRSGGMGDAQLLKARRELAELEAIDHRLAGERPGQSPEIDEFWSRWRHLYRDSGLVNPRGDRLLTELAVRALHQLRPRLLMVNYNDPDYVHWGNPSHYTRGIAVIDRGLQRLVDVVEADAAYRDNTVFVVVPDCGRDDNRAMRVPYQHHFNSRISHEIFALFFGAGIARNQVVDRAVDQVSVAATVGRLMSCATPHAEGDVLEEVLA